MKFSLALTAHLDALTAALDGSGDDLATIVTVLAGDLAMDISSFSGLSITVRLDGEPVTITAMESHTAGASMLLPLAAVGVGGHIVFYAHNPGAFTDLAADARMMLGPHGGDLVLDGDLPPPTAAAAAAGLGVLTDRASIDQAVGFLMGRGYRPQLARAELRRRAAAAGASLAWVAQQMLRSGLGPDPDPDAAPQAQDRDEQTG